MPFLGELSALLTACCWSGSSIVFASATVRVGSVYVNMTRLIIAAAMLSATVFLFGISVVVSSSQVVSLALSGVAGLVFGDTFLFKSYEYNSARVSSLVMSTAPAVTAVLAYALLGEVLPFWGLLGMLVTLAGIAVVLLERHDLTSSHMKPSAIGVVYAFLGSAGQAGGVVLAKLAFNEGGINGFVATLIRIAAAVVILFPLLRLAGRYRRPVKILLENKKALNLVLLGSLLGPYFGITFSLIAIQHTSTAIAATLMATVPIIMLPMAKILLHEKLTWRATTGAFVAVGGVAILFLR